LLLAACCLLLAACCLLLAACCLLLVVAAVATCFLLLLLLLPQLLFNLFEFPYQSCPRIICGREVEVRLHDVSASLVFGVVPFRSCELSTCHCETG
jgi:hypothetical protein